MWKHTKRSVALTLSFMMLVQPLHAYDTDLISIASGATSPGKPNVLLILDTSDSMNLGLAWNEVSQEDADNYNSHVEYLWNNLDYIARIGCYDKNQQICKDWAGDIASTTAFDNSENPPARNHAPLAYNDAYKYGSLPQGYFFSADLKNTAFVYANSPDTSNPTRRRYEIRDYSGIDGLHGDRGQGQASPCKYLLAPNNVAQSNGDSICATPIKSKYVWWTTKAPLDHIDDTDASLFSDSFNRFVGEDTVTPFSSLFAGDKINRGGMDFHTSRGVNYPGGYQLLANGNLPDQILDTVKLQLKSNQAGNNRCMSSYFGSEHASIDHPSGLIPSTVNAPGPFEKNAGYMVTGWVRWQPFRNAVRDTRLSPAGSNASWDMKLANYPGPFQVTETGEVLGWRDDRWLPPRIQVSSSDAGWESLQPDLGSYDDYYHALINLDLGRGLPSCSGAWPEYCDLGAAKDQFAAKLPRVLAYYGITSIPQEITDSLDFNKTVRGNPLNYQVESVTGDLRWSFTALRGVSATSGPAGSLPGISTYFDAATEQTKTCQATCKPIGTNPTSFDTVHGINNRTAYSYSSAVNCGVDTVPPDCDPATINCTPQPTTVPVRQFIQCRWEDRNSEGVIGEAGRTRYFGGRCVATCVGDCEKFKSTTPIDQVGNNNIGAGESPTTTVETSLRCDYDKDGNGDPADTYNTNGRCDPKPGLTTPQEVNCPTWYDATGTPHPTCIFYDASTPNLVCRPANGRPLGAITDLKYKFEFQHSDDLFADCTADNDRDASNTSFANQLDSFNPLIGTIASKVSTNTSKSFKTRYGDGSYGIATGSTPRNIAVYSSNYLNYKYGPKGKGPNGRPIGRQTRLQVAKDALATIVNSNSGEYRFGLMAFNDTDPKDGGSRGARMIFPVSDLSAQANNPATGKDDKAEFIKRLLWLEARSKTPLAPAMYEAYLYYAGKNPSSQYNVDAYNNKIATIPSRLPGIVDSKGHYMSPIDTTFSSSSGSSAAQQAYCLKNIIILITDGGPQDDDGMNADIKNVQGRAADNSSIGVGPQLIDSTTHLPFGPPDDKYRQLDGTYKPETYSYLDEMTNFLNKVSVRQTSGADKAFNNVTTFTIGFAGADSPVLQNAGDPTVSGGNYYHADNVEKLKDSIKQSLQTAREYVPTLSTPVTPLSALSKSQDADEIYISSIKPSTSKDIWPGNMKKYKLGSGESLCGTQSKKDATGAETFVPIDLCIIGQDVINGTIKNISTMTSPTNGSPPIAAISDQARSYWSESKDGRTVLKGGIFDRLLKTNVDSQGTPDVSKRRVYTHISGMFGGTPPSQQTGGALSLFEDSNADVVDSVAFSHVLSANDRKKIINQIRGADVTKAECSDANNLNLCTAFDSITRHESPLHSPGVVVTYKTGTPATKTAAGTAPEQRLFYATINGVMHAVDPRDETYGTSDNIGKEMWGFVPEEVLAQAADHPYFNLATQGPAKAVDGPIALLDGQPNVWLQPCKAGASCKNTNHPEIERAILYFGMRRGGGDLSVTKRGAHSFYAIDIKNPDMPQLLWKITSVPDTSMPPTTANPDHRIGYLCGADGSCQIRSAFSELGQSWSTPTPVKLNQRNTAGTDFVEGLVFTGGYDPRQDCVLPDKNMARRATITSGQKNDRDCKGTGDYDTQGRAIYVVDAMSGEPIATFMDADVASARAVNSKVISPPNLPLTPNTTGSGGLKMSNSVAGAVGAYNVDLDAANTIDRLYVGDMGGVLWRVDMQNTDPTKWAVYPIASLSTVDGNKNVQNDRPLFFQPQVFLSTDDAVLSGTNSQDKYDYVYIATSDFEHPTETGKGVNNKLFMVKDWESRGRGASDIMSLQPAIIGEFADLSNSSSMGGYISHMLNVTNLSINPGQNAQNAISSQLPAGTDWSRLQGWYVDFDIDPTSSNPIKQYPSSQWVEVATGPALIYKDRNPASATYGSSILNFTTYRYGTVDIKNCTASGVGYTWSMEATTGAAIVNPPSPSQNNPGSNSAAAAAAAGYHNRVAANDNGGFTTGSGTTTGLSATPSLKVINCQIMKTATSGALSYANVGEACSATKAYWYNQLN